MLVTDKLANRNGVLSGGAQISLAVKLWRDRRSHEPAVWKDDHDDRDQVELLEGRSRWVRPQPVLRFASTQDAPPVFGRRRSRVLTAGWQQSSFNRSLLSTGAPKAERTSEGPYAVCEDIPLRAAFAAF